MGPHAYIFHVDGSVSQRTFGGKPQMTDAVDALRNAMPSCHFVEMDVSVRKDGRQWVLIMDEEGAYKQPRNASLGGYLMNLEQPWFGAIALVLCDANDAEKLCELELLPRDPGDIMGIYHHLEDFRNDWRRVHGLTSIATTPRAEHHQ